MYFQQIRSATVKINYAGKVFLVDPWLSKKGAYPPIPFIGRDDVNNPVTELPFSIEKILQNVDAVIVTHTHFDHFDEAAKNSIPKDKLIFVQDEADEAELSSYGFTNLRVLSTSGSEYAGIKLYKTACQHGQGEQTEQAYAKMGFRRTTDACGVVFQADGEKTVYLAGDTVWFKGVQAAITKYLPEVIILNTAQAEFPNGCPIIMGLADIAAVQSAAPEATLIASHMGAVSHAHLTREEIRNFAAEKAIKTIWIPEDGEVREF